MAADLDVTSLRDALQAAVAAPAARRSVTVVSVHLAHAGALLSFCYFQRGSGAWSIRNIRRLTYLSAADCYFRGMVAIIQGPTSTGSVHLLGRYAVCLRDWATTIGDGFVEAATPVLDAIDQLADSARHTPELVTEAEFLADIDHINLRLQQFRTGQVPLAHADDYAAADDHDDTESDNYDDNDHLVPHNFLSLQHALGDIIQHPAGYRDITVYGLHVSDSGALLALVHMAPNWIVRNMDRLTDLCLLDASFQVIDRGLMRIIRENPNSQAARALLHAFVTSRIMGRAGMVGGQVADRATSICNALLDLNAAAADLSEHHLMDLHTRVSHFRSRQLAIDVSPDSSASSSS